MPVGSKGGPLRGPSGNVRSPSGASGLRTLVCGHLHWAACQTRAMGMQRGHDTYATKMRRLLASGTDLEVDVRFIDMISRRGARILDIGCGIGAAVSGLRSRGHLAYGVDPTPAVLEVAVDLFDPTWFRALAATELSRASLLQVDLPATFDVVLMSGNVPSFLAPAELESVFTEVGHLLDSGGTFVLGTTSALRGGPNDQDRVVVPSTLTLLHRFADWHLSPYRPDSPWSVSVFSTSGSREAPHSPDGMFILPG